MPQQEDWADRYRERARQERGYQQYPPSQRRRTSSTATILEQLSPESRNALTSPGHPGGGRAAPANPGRSFQQQHEAFLEESARANPYGGLIGGDTRSERYERSAGFEGYFGESEFVDPITNEEMFFAGDSRKILQTMTAENLARLQEQLESLGFLAGTYSTGALGDSTEKAFSDLLGESNRRGMTWNTTLRQLKKLHEEMGLDEDDEEIPKYTAPAYLAPDYAKLADTVRSTMRSELGREPDESEIAAMTSELDGWHREVFDQQVAAAEATFNAEVAGAPTTEGEFTEVDPLARFQEAFREKYKGQIEYVQETVPEVAEAQATVQGGVGGLSQMSRGGA